MAPYDDDSDYEDDFTNAHLGLADGALEGDDEANPLVSRIGGRGAGRGPRHEGGPGTRAHAADERARNVQTFGDNAASYRGSNRRGGRSRGGRGRGPRKESKPAWA